MEGNLCLWISNIKDCQPLNLGFSDLSTQILLSTNQQNFFNFHLFIMSDVSTTKYVLGTVGVLGFVVLLKYRSFLRSSSRLKSSITKPTVPEKVTFVGSAEYAVLTAIIDALIPSRSIEECKDLLKEYVGNSVFELLGEKKINKNMGYFCSGAVNYGTNRHFAETIEVFCSKEEKTQLYLFLVALSTSFGCLLLTGYPLPFQVSILFFCFMCL